MSRERDRKAVRISWFLPGKVSGEGRALGFPHSINYSLSQSFNKHCSESFPTSTHLSTGPWDGCCEESKDDQEMVPVLTMLSGQ